MPWGSNPPKKLDYLDDVIVTIMKTIELCDFCKRGLPEIRYTLRNLRGRESLRLTNHSDLRLQDILCCINKRTCNT